MGFYLSQGNEERRSGSSSSVPISQLEDLMRRRGVDAAWDALEDAWTVSDNKQLGVKRGISMIIIHLVLCTFVAATLFSCRDEIPMSPPGEKNGSIWPKKLGQKKRSPKGFGNITDPYKVGPKTSYK